MPPRATRLAFKNQYGIFSGGINSVIQALARQRTNQPIHIILPKPDKFDYESLQEANMNTNQQKKFKQIYDSVVYFDENEKPVTFLKQNKQYHFIKEFYEEKLKGYLSSEINKVSSVHRGGLPSLNFPNLKSFILENGENYLANKFKIFGEDISAYVTYASITNQFLNCKLKHIYIKKNEFFTKENIIKQLINFNSRESLQEKLSLYEWSPFAKYLEECKKILYNQYNIKIKNIRKVKNEDGVEEEKTFYEFKNSDRAFFEKNLLKWLKSLYNQEKIEDFTRADYILNCAIRANEIDIENITDTLVKKRVLFFKALHYYIHKVLQEVKVYNKRNRHYYYIKTKFNSFTDVDIEQLSIIEKNLESDNYMNKVFNFSRNFKDGKTTKEKIQSLIRILKKDFLILEVSDTNPKIIIDGKKTSVTRVLGYKLILNKRLIDFFGEDINWEQIGKDNKELQGKEEYNRLVSALNIEEVIQKIREEQGF